MEYSVQKIDNWSLFIFAIGVFLASIKINISGFNADIYFYYFLTIPIFLFKYYKNIKINRKILIFFIFILLHSVINITVGNNTISLFIKNFIGLLVFTIIYYTIINLSGFNLIPFFNLYCKLSFWISIIGIIQYFSWYLKFKPGYDFSWLGFPVAVENGKYLLHSIFSEPAHYATVLSASLFISIRNLFNNETYFINKKKSLIILFSFYLTSSSIGYIAIFISVLLLTISYRNKKSIILLASLPILAIYIYNNQPRFKERFDSFNPKEVISHIEKEKVDEATYNGSVLILLNGFNVARETANQTIIGAGLGSYFNSYNKRSFLIGTSLNEKNRYDGNSMFNRVLAEFGYLGIIVLLIFIVKYKIKKETKKDTIEWVISNSIFIMLFLVLLRQGHYFTYGLPFFILSYYYLKKNQNAIQ